jgi:Flp pilus assembly protein TadD
MPWLLAGWLWYLILLLPALGIGEWALADRLTYLPHGGLNLILAWGAAALLARWSVPKSWTVAAALAVLLALSMRTRQQLAFWKDSETLLTHAIAATRDNPVAYSGLADDLARRGFAQEAMARYHTALDLHPGFTKAHNNMGNVLLEQGRDAEAIAHFETALKIRPDFPEAHHNLGRAFLHQGRIEEAVGKFREAVRLKPDRAEFQEALGVALTRAGRLAEAEGPLREAVRLAPEDAKAQNNLGMALASQGRLEEAVRHFEEALRLQPGYPEARRNLETARKDPRFKTLSHF